MAIKHSGYIEERKYMQINSISLMDHGCTMGKLVIRTKQAPPPAGLGSLGCCCVEVVVVLVVVFVVVGRIAYFIWPFQQLFVSYMKKVGAPNGDEEDKAKKKKSLRDQKKKLLDPTQLAQGRHHQTNNLRERERRVMLKEQVLNLWSFQLFRNPKIYFLSGSCELHVWIENN